MSIGIDFHINRLIVVFNSKLWVGKNKYFVGRVFRIIKDSKVIPSKSIDGTNEYQVALKNDNYDAECFFDVMPQETIISGVHHADINLCFMVNLASLYPTLNRLDATENVHVDIERLLRRSNIEFTELTRGITSFDNYDMSGFIISDMSPHYLFRCTIKINYTNSNC